LGFDRIGNTSTGGPKSQNLLDYFIKKIKDIRQSTGNSPPSTKFPPSTAVFERFELYSPEEIRKQIQLTKSKSCSLDPIRTTILKEFLEELLPFVTEMCNRSLQQGWLSISKRHAIVKPIIKKEELDQDDVKNYRSISNLTYMSKIAERMVYSQLTTFLEGNNMLLKHQLGFRARHSTETAVIKVMSDILTAADQRRVTLVGLLDMSAAFDTVDHDNIATAS